jgi:hypothetical protein
MKYLIAAGLLSLAVAVGGCSLFDPAVPPFVTDTSVVVPAECDTDQTPPTPNPPRPKADTPAGASTAEALRDRGAWETAITIERGRRRACSERLKVLYPDSVAAVKEARAK